MAGVKTKAQIYLERLGEIIGDMEKRIERLEMDAEQRRQQDENKRRYGLHTDQPRKG